MKSTLVILSWFVASIFVSELLGYLLHRLLHRGTIGFLSRGHMKHHLLLYGPLQSQRPGMDYQDATTGQVAVGNVGLEWLLPGAVLLALCVSTMTVLQVRLLHQAIFIAGSLGWSFLMFSYLHDRMHIAGFWMESNVLFRKWFIAARDAHDIHHWSLDDEGLMDKNFGIAFFFFDRLFGTLARERTSFNQRGYASALSRFGIL